MILADMPFEYLDVSAHAALPDQLSRPFSYISSQSLAAPRIAVLRRPHEVILDVILGVPRMRAPAIFRHQDDIVPEGAKALRLKAKALDLTNGSKKPHIAKPCYV